MDCSIRRVPSPGLLQAMEGSVERAFFYAQQLVGDVAHVGGDGVARHSLLAGEVLRIRRTSVPWRMSFSFANNSPM